MTPRERKRLHIVPMTLAGGNEAIRRWHRHHKPVPGSKFIIGVADDDGELHGILIAGRPVARAYDNGTTLEVTRCAVDGEPNANSALYGAAARAAWALGYLRLITYTRTDEGGQSLRGAGWKIIATRGARSWASSSVSRVREDHTEPHERFLWEAPT